MKLNSANASGKNIREIMSIFFDLEQFLQHQHKLHKFMNIFFRFQIENFMDYMGKGNGDFCLGGDFSFVVCSGCLYVLLRVGECFFIFIFVCHVVVL